jgi:hypothetical protein
MDAAPSTRSATPRTVAEIVPLAVSVADVSTRSENGTESIDEELFYTVNFANDAGYSVIAADNRIKDEIVLFVGHGNLDVENIENPGLAVMLSRLDDYATRSIAEHEAWCDSVETAMLSHISEEYAEYLAEYLASAENADSQTRVPPGYTPTPEYEYEIVDTQYAYGPWGLQSRIGPMIPVEWGQTAPFNAKASLMVGQEVYTGCVTTATIQLMAYWKKPTTFHGQSIDWVTTRTVRNAEEMYVANPDIRNTLADVFWNLGEDVNMEWGEIGIVGSGADSQDAINVLGTNGFTITSKRDYSYNPVVSSLQNNRPVYIRGDSHKTEHRFLGINWWSTYKKGHAWLIDGYLKQQQTVTVTYIWKAIMPPVQDGVLVSKPETRTTTSTFTNYREFFHNNFGWDSSNGAGGGYGTGNGYYLPGLFDPVNSRDLPSETRADESYLYRYDFEMFTNIHHN